MAEAAAGSIGVETPISPEKAVKIVVLNFVSLMAITIAGLGLGSDAIEMISMYDHYYDKTENEAKDVDRGNGEAATNMAIYHFVEILYAHFQLGVIALLGYNFRFWLTTYDDEFTCDLQEGTITPATYADAFPIIE